MPRLEVRLYETHVLDASPRKRLTPWPERNNQHGGSVDESTVYLHTDGVGLVPMTRQTCASEAELQGFVARNPV